MTTLNISLSRAHKLTERLKQLFNDASAKAQTLASPEALAGVAGEAHIARINAQGAEALAQGKQALEYSAALTSVRTVIGRENEARGISAKMAHLEHLNRTIALWTAVHANGSQDGITTDDLGDYRSLQAPALTPRPISVKVVTKAELDVAATALKAAKQEAFALSDDIAEANARPATFELPDAIAAEITGK